MSSPRWLFLALLACLISIVNAAPSASTFILPSYGSNITFSLSIDGKSDDIYFRLTASSDYSWVAVGIGPGMTGALMFVAYQGKDSKAVTLSPRIASGNVEPTYHPNKFNVTLESGSSTTDTQFVVNARCTNCRKWDSGSLDITSRGQDFIYAWGPSSEGISTDSQSAFMQRHIAYGTFSMDMVQATSDDAGVPQDTKNRTGAGIGNTTSDYNFALLAHVLLMLGAFVVLFPVGVLFLRVFQKVKLHSINQSLAVIVVLIGGGLGIYLSTMFNLTRTFSTPHQVIGIIIMVLLIVQAILGYLHHRAYLRTQRRTAYSHAHIWHGRLVILLGILNGFLGLSLVGRSSLGYLLGLLFFIAIYCSMYFIFWTRSRRKRDMYLGPRARNFRDEDPGPFSNSQADIPLTANAAPPAYQADYVPPNRI